LIDNQGTNQLGLILSIRMTRLHVTHSLRLLKNQPTKELI